MSDDYKPLLCIRTCLFPESFVNITSFRKFFCTKRRRNICVNSLNFLYTLLYAPVGRQPNDLEAGQITKLY